jgi:hypothetical protein
MLDTVFLAVLHSADPGTRTVLIENTSPYRPNKNHHKHHR